MASDEAGMGRGEGETRHRSGPGGGDQDPARHSASPAHDAEEEATRDASPAELRATQASPASIPESIGRFRVLGKLGEGGMGVVYEAEQQDPRRLVALKVIRGGGFVDDSRVRMFQREVETLARLTHPNIGAIYESGRTEDGQHYFAMELVRGQNLDAYLATRPPATAPDELAHRLRLFVKIASAVHHAHQRGVIHRDLKPSNIVVTAAASLETSGASNSGMPEIKILDFGLARITDEDVRAATMVTEIGVIKGTLPYMSPEQARGDAAALDVRTDVYALGVLLYEMVAGQRPYDVVQASLLEAVRVICEEPPRSIGATWSGSRRLDADVETIVGKALEKEPDRRYGSAAALADDVGRFLVSEPILARPPSAAYQLKKFAQRHRPMVAGAAMTALALVAGIVTSTALFVRAEREAERARIEADSAEQVGKFLQEMLAGVGPSVAQGRDTTLLREILDRTSERIAEELADEPEIEAALRSTLGTTYYELNEFEPCAAQYERALALYRELRGDEHEDVAQSYSNIGLLESKRGHDEPAVENLRRAVEIGRRVHGEKDGKTAEYLNYLGNVLSAAGKYDEALEYLTPALAIMRETFGDDRAELGTAINSIGTVYHYLGRYDEAEEHYREALEIHRRALGETHPFVATDLSNLAHIASSRGDAALAETRFREVVERQRKLFPDGDESIIVALSGLAKVLRWSGRLDEAEACLTESLDLSRRLFGEGSNQVARQLNALGSLYEEKGDYRGALEAFEAGLAINRKLYGKDNPQLGVSLNNVGLARARLGDHDEAIAMLSEAVEIYSAVYGPESGDTTLALNNLGRAYRAADRLDRAEEAFRDALARRRRSVGDSHFSTAVSMLDLARVLGDTGRTSEAVDLSRDALTAFESSMGPEHLQTSRVEIKLADALREDGRLEQAETLMRASWARQIEIAGEDSERALLAGVQLGRILADGGSWDEAEALYDKALVAPPGVLSPPRLAAVRLFRGQLLTERGRFTAAHEMLESSYRGHLQNGGSRSSGAQDAAKALADLHQRWHAADPGGNHSAQAEIWRRRASERP